ncbi:MAG TPA: hypothetical protein VFZ79_05130 [Acidimicrobiales bacterium]
MTAVELVVTLEELGRVADPTPFLATTSQYVPLADTVRADRHGDDGMIDPVGNWYQTGPGLVSNSS